MDDTTSQAQKAFFEANGYLVVENIISQTALEQLRAQIDGVLEGHVRPNTTDLADFAIQWEPHVQYEPGLPRRDKVRVVFHLCHNHDFFWQHATRSELTDVVCNLLGPDVKLYTDQMFVKPPRHGSEVPFHQDSSYWPAVEPPHMLSCWLAIDDATVENGCVHVVPGTHRRLLPHRRFEGPQSLGLLESDVDATRERPIELKAGSAMFHHSLLIHRSFPNRSPKPRRGLVTIYMPATAHLLQPWPFNYGFKLIRGQEHEGCI